MDDELRRRLETELDAALEESGLGHGEIDGNSVRVACKRPSGMRTVEVFPLTSLEPDTVDDVVRWVVTSVEETCRPTPFAPPIS